MTIPGDAAVTDVPPRLTAAHDASTARAAEAVARFEAELRPLIPQALRLAAGMLLDGAAAEDAVQEAALLAWQRQDNRRQGTELGPWFLGIVANRCREARRGRWFRVLKLAEPRPAVPSAPADDAARSLDVRRALQNLPPQERLPLVLRFYLDLPMAEVAAVLGCSLEAAKSRLRRALRRALPELAEIGGEDHA